MREDALFIGGVFLVGATAATFVVLCGLNRLLYGKWL